MHTQRMVSYIQKKAPGFEPSEILTVIDEVHRLIMSKVTVQRQSIDTTTGMPPYLATQQGVYQYDCPADCLKTLSVFTRDSRGYRGTNFRGPYTRYNWTGLLYPESVVGQIDATRGRVATVTFVNDPGTTTDRYFHLYMLRPVEISSTEVQLQIPEQWHLDFIDGVLARIRNERFGDKSEWNHWTTNTMTAMVQQLNYGAQRRKRRTLTQPEYQWYGRANSHGGFVGGRQSS